MERQAHQQTERVPGPSIASAIVQVTSSISAIPRKQVALRSASRISSTTPTRPPASRHRTRFPSTTRIVPTTKSTRGTSRTCPCAKSCGSIASMSPTTARSFVDMTSLTKRPYRAVAEAGWRPSRNVAPAVSTAFPPRHLNGRSARPASLPSRRSRPRFRGQRRFRPASRGISPISMATDETTIYGSAGQPSLRRRFAIGLALLVAASDPQSTLEFLAPGASACRLTSMPMEPSIC